MRKAVLSSLMILVLGSALTRAQIASEAAVSDSTPKIARPLPFKVGETLSYDVSFSKYIFGGDVADLKLSVTRASQPSLLELKADLVSKGFFPKLFGIKVKNRFTAVVSSSDLGLFSSTKLIEEDKSRREQTSILNRETGKLTYTDRDLVNSKSAPQVKETAAPNWLLDTIAGLYFLRTQTLEEGKVIAIPLTDYGNVYNVEVVVGKSEEIKVDAGKFKTVMLDAKIFDGRYLRRKGEMHIWVTDDARRIPVRARIKTDGTTVTINLKRIS